MFHHEVGWHISTTTLLTIGGANSIAKAGCVYISYPSSLTSLIMATRVVELVACTLHFGALVLHAHLGALVPDQLD